MTTARILLYRFPEEPARRWSEVLSSIPCEVVISDNLKEGSGFDLGYIFWEKPELPSPPSVSPWVAVVPHLSPFLCGYALELGYLGALEIESPPWAIFEPIFRVRRRDKIIEELHRLLNESVEFHNTLSLLEEIRRLIPELRTSQGYPSLLQLYMRIFEASSGALWLREFRDKDEGDWFFLQATTSPPPPALFSESFREHEVPILAQLHGKEPLFLSDPPYTLLAPLGSKDSLCGIVYLHRSQPFARLHRYSESFRILNSWLLPLLNLSLSYRDKQGEHPPAQEPDFPGRIQQLLRLARRYERPLTTVWAWVPDDLWKKYDILGVLSSLLRDSDLIGTYDGAKIPIALPETSYMGGEYFLRRLSRELKRRYPLARIKIITTLATTPYQGLLLEDLVQYHEDEYASLTELERFLGPYDSPSVWIRALKSSGKGLTFRDPNLWGDLFCTTIAELTLIHPRESRLCLYLTDPERIQKWFSSLNQANIAWDRVLLTGDRPIANNSWGGLYVVDAGLSNPLFLLLLDSPWGGIVALAEEEGDTWYGALFWERGWARVLFDLWENRFMIHKRWLVS